MECTPPLNARNDDEFYDKISDSCSIAHDQDELKYEQVSDGELPDFLINQEPPKSILPSLSDVILLLLLF